MRTCTIDHTVIEGCEETENTNLPPLEPRLKRFLPSKSQPPPHYDKQQTTTDRPKQ